MGAAMSVCDNQAMVKLCRTMAIRLAWIGAASLAFSAAAQYPVKPVKLMSPFPPGGGTDIVARQTSQGLSARLGQPVVIEAQAGAGGLIATQTVARATPDGYTILFGVPSTVTIAENFTKNPDYNPARDLAPIATVASYFTLFLVNPKVNANTLPEFITLAKANPKKFFYGTLGNGHAFHMLTELVSRQARLEQELLLMQKDPGFTEKVIGLDFGPVGIGSKEFTTLLEGERKRWHDIIAAASIKAELE
ncbi:MAG: hypothetical protein EXR28_04695 [Betaproteobacteria bacterium]|nr:hypothetical protein [Betaproteobacteria bacterium]